MATTKTNVRSLSTQATLFLTRQAWRIAPKWANAWGARQFFRPWTFHPKPEQLAILQQGQAFHFSSGAHQLQAWQWGTGRKILLLHGWSGRGLQFYLLIEALQAAGWQPITFDQPAHGPQGGLTNIYEFIQAAQDLLAVIGPVEAVIGHSMGSIPALRVAEQFAIPGILYAPSVHFRRGMVRWAHYQGLYAPLTRELLHSLEEQYGTPLRELNPQALLKKIKKPILIMHDWEDRSTSAQASLAVAEPLPLVTHQQSRGLGHNRILEDPAMIESALHFLEQHR